MLSMDIKSLVATIAQYRKDVDSSSAPIDPPFVRNLRLQRIQADLPALLHGLKQHKGNKAYASTLEQIHLLSNQVSQLLFHNHAALSDWVSQFKKVQLSVDVPEEASSTEIRLPDTKEENEESYTSLRRRLLSDGTSAIKLGHATNEELDLFHESIQEDLLSELSDLTSTLKTSAQNLSSKIMADATLVSETSELMAKNLSLMQSVGQNLNNYLGAKTGGRISLFFMIKVMVFVFVLFFSMAFIAKFLPKM